MTTQSSLRVSVLLLVVALWQACAAVRPPPEHSAAASDSRIDHVMVGASDLDRAVDEFERVTGIRPVYGGRHPAGTHNALVSLGNGTYLELIAPQRGQSGSPFLRELAGLKRLTPIGWAVSTTDDKGLRERLRIAGLLTTQSTAGSRTTPTGETLNWQTFFLQEQLAGAPFFITWAAETAHPSATSPGGCKLERLVVAGPKTDPLKQLRRLIDGPIEVARSPEEQFAVSFLCPKGRVVFGAAGPL